MVHLELEPRSREGEGVCGWNGGVAGSEGGLKGKRRKRWREGGIEEDRGSKVQLKDGVREAITNEVKLRSSRISPYFLLAVNF